MKRTKSIDELKQMNLEDINTLINLNHEDIWVYIGNIRQSEHKGGALTCLTGYLSTENPAHMNGGLQINMEYTDGEVSWREYYRRANR